MKSAEKSVAKYDVRAPPRRRQKGSELDEQPVFLRKAFAMISSCPPEIGGWSDSGDTVVIKDVKAFSEKIIPTAYKHNNFSSFVRQLNFYGFRKVKSNVMHHTDWWEFRHPHFVRDKPHLLSEIKRSVHFENGGGDVSELRNQVVELNNRVNKLANMLESLSCKVEEQSPQPSAGASEPRRKVRAKVSSSSSPSQCEEESSLSPIMKVPSGFGLNEMDMEDSPRDTLFTIEGLEGDMLFDNILDMNDPPLPSPPMIPPVKIEPIVEESKQADGTSATGIAEQVATVLTVLPPDMQQRFIDKLAETMGAQLAAFTIQNNDKIQSLTLPSGQAPDIALPLASAALGAFVMSSLQSLSTGPVVAKKAPTISA